MDGWDETPEQVTERLRPEREEAQKVEKENEPNSDSKDGTIRGTSC